MTKIQAHRYHDISCGHRVVGHESRCRFLHGHNYRVHFYCESNSLDELGRVIDFGVIKQKLCMWIEDNWDHKFLHWEKDELLLGLLNLAEATHVSLFSAADEADFFDSMVALPFNPTAENMAEHLVNVIGPEMLIMTGVKLTKVIIEETRKCFVTVEKS